MTLCRFLAETMRSISSPSRPSPAVVGALEGIYTPHPEGGFKHVANLGHPNTYVLQLIFDLLAKISKPKTFEIKELAPYKKSKTKHPEQRRCI